MWVCQRNTIFVLFLETLKSSFHPWVAEAEKELHTEEKINKKEKIDNFHVLYRKKKEILYVCEEEKEKLKKSFFSLFLFWKKNPAGCRDDS